MSSHPHFTRSQWIRFRAEQLAVRAEPITFASLYAKRSVEFGFPDYEVANQAFRDFLQPFIGDARRAWETEQHAAIWYQHKPGVWAVPDQGPKVVEIGGEKVLAHDAVDPDEDEDENDECEECGAVIGKGDGMCADCEDDDDE
jgi:hypothetical protein